MKNIFKRKKAPKVSKKDALVALLKAEMSRSYERPGTLKARGAEDLADKILEL